MARGESAFDLVPLANVKHLPVPETPVFKPTLASALPADLAEPEFIVGSLIPKRELTLFTGQPDIGKTWLVMALTIACGLGRSWLRCPGTRKCKSLTIYSEDPAHVLKVRRDVLCKHYGADPVDLELFVSWMDRTECGPNPIIFKGNGKFSSKWETFPLWQEIRRHITENGIELLILDNATSLALLYDDQHVTTFCRWLINEAEALNIAIVLLHHPPVADDRGRKWYSGTGKWAQAIRNSLTVQTVRKKEDDSRQWIEDDDDGRRMLIAPKNNYLPYGHWMKRRGMMLQWKDGVLQRTGS